MAYYITLSLVYLKTDKNHNSNMLDHFDDLPFLLSMKKNPSKDKMEKAEKQAEAMSSDTWRPVIASTSNKLVVL